MIAQEELLHQHATELAQQAAEIADQLYFEQLPAQEHELHIHLEHDHMHDHHIEMKEGHTCGPDCPEHGSKHNHEEHHHEHEAHHDHHIEQKAHVCGPDCPEHRHKHDHAAEREPHEHHIEAKAHEHRCGPDCPEHGHAHTTHEHEHPADTKAPERHIPQTVEAAEPLRAEQHHADVAHYERIEAAIRQAQVVETEEHAAGQAPAQTQAEATPTRAVAEAETATVIPEQLVQHELQTMLDHYETEMVVFEALASSEATQSDVSTSKLPEALPLAYEPIEVDEPLEPLTDTGEIVTESDTLPEVATVESVEPILDFRTAIEPVDKALGPTDLPELAVNNTPESEPMPPIVMTIAERLNELKANGKETVEPVLQDIVEAIQLIDVLEAEEAATEAIETIQAELEELAVTLLEQLDIEYEAEDIERLITLLLRLEDQSQRQKNTGKLYTVDLEHNGTREARLHLTQLASSLADIQEKIHCLLGRLVLFYMASPLVVSGP